MRRPYQTGRRRRLRHREHHSLMIFTDKQRNTMEAWRVLCVGQFDLHVLHVSMVIFEQTSETTHALSRAMLAVGEWPVPAACYRPSRPVRCADTSAAFR